MDRQARNRRELLLGEPAASRSALSCAPNNPEAPYFMAFHVTPGLYERFYGFLPSAVSGDVATIRRSRESGGTRASHRRKPLRQCSDGHIVHAGSDP